MEPSSSATATATATATAKAIPTTSQVVKYQPPLMRFLRGSKSSRARSRAIPLFTRRKRAAIDAHHQEPSSPKVTCIGQVRIRRSSSKSRQQSALTNRDPPKLKRRTSSSSSAAGNWFCFWVGKPPAVCCSFRFSRRKSSCRFRPFWRILVSFFCCKSAPVPTDSPKKEPISTESGLIYTETDSDSFDIIENRGEEFGEKEDEDEEETEEDCLGQVPPKNALLLTRCTSAPQRSSYLASQFWGLQENRENTAEAESRIDGDGEGNLEISEEEVAKTLSVTGVSDKAGTSAMKTQKALNPCAEEKQGVEEEEEEQERIAVLTRCKSEPPRTSGDPLSSSFWRERRNRMESTVSCRNSVESECRKN